MSHLSVRGEQSTSTEITALTNLASLATSGDGEFIRKIGTATFENATISGSISLDGLSDVVITNPASGQTLAYNGSAWINSSEAGSGTVTSVSVTTANGVSGSVATSTTTPAITLTLGAITPSSIALGTGSITMTGSIAATGARVTKGWFTDVESTNMYTVGGTSLSSTFEVLTNKSTDTALGTSNTLYPSQNAVKTYIDNLFAGFSPRTSCKAATTAALTATYLNGASGVGATLTNGGALAAFSVDGVSPSATDRILIKDQATAAENGIYIVTTVGSGAVAWVLTRATDYDTSAEVFEGTYTLIEEGTANARTLWEMTKAGTITMGTTDIDWSELLVAPQAHNSLTSIQGGTTNEYYHLTSAEYTGLSGLTNSEIVITDGSGNLASAAVATYPSLTELTYVKGVTSALQTQLGLKAPLASPTFTGTVTIPTPFTLGAVSVTSTGTQLNYLNAATGTTGTTSTNLVFSTSPTFTTPILGTPTSGTLTNCTGLPIDGLVDDTTSALGVGTIELGHASDTTFARVSAGVVSIEGSNIIKANTTATRTIVLTAAGGSPTTTAGCGGPTKVEAGTNDIDYWALEFDAATDESAFWNITMPDSYDGGTITAQFIWTNAGGASTETVAFDIAARAYANDDAIDQAYGTAVETTDTWLAQGDIHISAASSAITIGGTPAGGQPVMIRVTRDVSEDTLTGDARLLAVKLEYGINAYTD